MRATEVNGMERILVKKQEAADRIQVSLRTLEKLIASEQIKTVRIAEKCVRIPVGELKRFAEENTR